MKKFNKITLLFTVCLIAVALVFVLAACDEPGGNNGDGEHTHDSWSAWSLKTMPTQDAEGSVTRSCTVEGCTEVQTVAIPALSSATYTVGSDTATCGAAGTKSYTVTITGGGTFTFNVSTSATGAHDLTPNSAVASTCTVKGHEAYWECGTCHKKFSDANGTNEIEDVVETALDPDNHDITPVQAVPASCKKDGTSAHYKCNDCGKLFSDANGANVITAESVVVSKDTVNHTLTNHPAVAVDCQTDGVDEYWSCDVCEKLFSDEECENEITEPVVTSKNTVSHELTHHDEEPKSCYMNGWEEYWSCDVCNRMFSDAEAENEIEMLVSIPAGHTIVPVAEGTENLGAVQGNCGQWSNYAYYTCSVCGLKYLDEEATHIITSAIYSPHATLGGVLLQNGNNKVHCVSASTDGTSYLVNYKNSEAGECTFTVGSADVNIVKILYASGSGRAMPVYQDGAWVTTGTNYSKFTSTDNVASGSFAVNMAANDYIVIYLDDDDFEIELTQILSLVFGDNSVVLPESYVGYQFDFTPDETKTYMLTIPTGMNVDLVVDPDDMWSWEELINSTMETRDTCSGTFDGVAGEKLTFCLTWTSAPIPGNTFSVTIGDLPPEAPKLVVGTPFEVTANNISNITSGQGEMTTVIVGNNVEAGRYTLSIKGSPRSLVQARAGVIFAKNTTSTLSELIGRTDPDKPNNYNANNGTADVYFSGGMMTATVVDTEDTDSNFEASWNRSTATITITLNLEAGDELAFIIEATSTLGLTITLTAVA